ncbi:MAG TPA: ABC transporter permease [Sporichthyaceae bacterium]|nr:ABC transporter permease [Sporichthyaceae bacterium]
MTSLLVDVAAGAVAGGTSIMYAGLGETISERAGIINLGTEGCMLAGALGGYAIAARTGTPWAGVVAGGLAGAALALVHGVLVINRKANQFASGFTVLFLALGLTSLWGVHYVGATIHALHPWRVPGLGSIPGLGPVFFRHDPLTYASFVAAPVIWWVLDRTRVGLLLRTAGERPEALEVNGYRVAPVQYAAVAAGGALAGLGGAQLSLAVANAWFENMVAGRGFIAVALVIFAAWHPMRVMAGSYLFGAALALGPALQARGHGVNQFALDVIPYVLTLLVLAALGRRTLQAAPDGLKRVFDSARVA